MANDLDVTATEAIARNRAHNKLDPSKLPISQLDASFLMQKISHQERLHSTTAKQELEEFQGFSTNLNPIAVIDLDPYGSSAPFMDAAVGCIANNGLLALTCTDLAVLCGNYAESCFAKYGSMPPKRTQYCHELALRIVLGSLSMHAARHHRAIVPLVSFFADFYVRIFVQVVRCGGELQRVPSRLGYVYQCASCHAWNTQPVGHCVSSDRKPPNNLHFHQANAPTVPSRCEHCDGCWKMSGQIWLDPIHQKDWIARALEHLESNSSMYHTAPRMRGMFTCMQEELNIPFYYSLSQLSNMLHLQTPKLDSVLSALIRQNYEVSGTHCQPGAFKTTAPYSAVLDVMRSWHLLTPAKLANMSVNSPAYKILSVPPKQVANFDIVEQLKKARHTAKQEKILRYMHPPPYWGPATRARKRRYSPTEDKSQNTSPLSHTVLEE
ncbi:tRNA (guanine(26)-N(2))-dimethyltransferase-like isoform X2 [Schistocerca gregaria]|nr:tRNA (guanine(26)-N(2))-dimethyltransferase-like isoform X2 [Schistocerca gregaria]XP_049849100.1 tRNA (guanine(26)-N(2))-dimethyltransferase-like isoform X2 [Schistocerca gregaria]